MNTDLFVNWLEHFQNHVKASEITPVLLVLDNHVSHISLEAYDFCKRNFIHMVSFPPHTSNNLQPLDLTFFAPFKGKLYSEYALHLTNTAHEKIMEADVAELINRAFVKKLSRGLNQLEFIR